MKLGNSAAASSSGSLFRRDHHVRGSGFGLSSEKYLAVSSARMAARSARRSRSRSLSCDGAACSSARLLARNASKASRARPSAPFEAPRTAWRKEATTTRSAQPVGISRPSFAAKSGSDAMMRPPVNSVTKDREANTPAPISPRFDRNPTPKSETALRITRHAPYDGRAIVAGAAVTYDDQRRGEKRSAAPTATSTRSKTRIADELRIEHSPRQNALHILGFQLLGLPVRKRSQQRVLR
mmetsp:Transcript_15055/g.42776  ORF Transcript_15055/g.42776 Transcript_15055/m.42776 type:complete len:239 (-) Transcript_15055:94-810(-)